MVPELEKALSYLVGLGAERNQVRFERRPGDAPDVVVQVGPGEKVQEVILRQKPLDVELHTPAEFKHYWLEHGADKAEGQLFYDDAGIFGWLSKDRRDRATCRLRKSPAWLALEKPQSLQHVHFVRLLRVTFRNCLDPDSTLLETMRSIRFEAGQGTRLEQRQGRESMERSAKAEVGQEIKLPEDVLLRVRVFENYGHVETVACALEILPSEQLFRLSPYPMELVSAMEATLANLAEELPQPNFLGTPVRSLGKQELLRAED